MPDPSFVFTTWGLNPLNWYSSRIDCMRTNRVRFKISINVNACKFTINQWFVIDSDCATLGI